MTSLYLCYERVNKVDNKNVDLRLWRISGPAFLRYLARLIDEKFVSRFKQTESRYTFRNLKKVHVLNPYYVVCNFVCDFIKTCLIHLFFLSFMAKVCHKDYPAIFKMLPFILQNHTAVFTISNKTVPQNINMNILTNY